MISSKLRTNLDHLRWGSEAKWGKFPHSPKLHYACTSLVLHWMIKLHIWMQNEVRRCTKILPENIPFKIVNDVHFYSLQSAPASVFTHWNVLNVNSFISLVMICLIAERIMLQRWKVKLKYIAMSKTKMHLKTENASTDYRSVSYYASVCQ